MKNISVSIVAVVVLSSFPVMVAAQNRVLGHADIPFTFEAHGQTFERGSYELRQIGTQVVRLQNVVDGKGVTLLSSQTIAESGTTTIAFYRDRDRRWLAAVIAPSFQISVARPYREKQSEASAKRTSTVALQVKH